jgi:hypothetical protein
MKRRYILSPEALRDIGRFGVTSKRKLGKTRPIGLRQSSAVNSRAWQIFPTQGIGDSFDIGRRAVFLGVLVSDRVPP